MATREPSVKLRSEMRERINLRLEQLALKRDEAATLLGLAPAQLSRLRAGQDIFTLDRLVDAAGALGISVRLQATRPYHSK